MIKVTKRITVNGYWEYVDVPNDCKTYKDTIIKFGGKQDWYDKKTHRFTVNGELFLMSKTKKSNQ